MRSLESPSLSSLGDNAILLMSSVAFISFLHEARILAAKMQDLTGEPACGRVAASAWRSTPLTAKVTKPTRKLHHPFFRGDDSVTEAV